MDIKIIKKILNGLKIRFKIIETGYKFSDKLKIAIYFFFLRFIKSSFCLPLKIKMYGGSILSVKKNSAVDIWVSSANNHIYSVLKNKKYGNVLDVGANIGSDTIVFSKLVDGTVFSFEPNRENFNRLSENIKLNNLKNVKHYRLACFNKKGKLKLGLSNHSHGGHSVIRDESGKFEEIESIRLDNFLNEKIDFIKIDVEGAELNVLKGAKNLLKNCSPDIVFECFNENEFGKIKSFLKKRGYKEIRLLCGSDYFATH